ncbi:uncharacterized protein [Ptychodera flava]|uniref:uncharacterized protein n=1 Tax=Ptychodera flava TaxID=63121 RepID=UPI00396A3F5A
MDKLNPLRSLFYDVAKALSQDEMKTLIQLLKGKQIAIRDIEKMETAEDIFIKLEDMGIISDKNLKFLKELLLKLGRRTLVDLVESFEQEHGLSRVMVAPEEQRDRHTMPLEQTHKTQDPSLLIVADRCEKELRDIYQTTLSDVRPFPWSSAVHIEDIYTLPELQHKHGSKVTSFDRINIFSDRKVGRKYNPTRRVLIESDPGYGKSTFCLKLAYDWAVGDVGFIKDFKLVFLLKLQCFQEKIEDVIFDTLLPEDCFIDKKQLLQYMRENQEHVVFLLDGWDEMAETATGDIKKILEGTMLRHSKVIVTSRKIRDDKRAKQRVKSHFDLSLQLMGFSLESLKEYVCKHFDVTEQSDRVNVFIEQINRSQVKGTLLKMMTCPLNSLLICDMWTATGSLTQNKTQLYQRIVDIIVKIYCENEGKVYETVRDGIDEQFVFLGELAFKSLLDSKFKIDKSELHLEKNSDILKMGFLTRYTADRQVVLAIDPMTSFLIHHRTFQEFFAAKYLASLRREENTQKFRQTLRNFYCRMSKDCSPVLQFVAGFLKEACGDMFDVFCDSISRLDLIIECLKESTQPYSKSLLFTAAKATKDTCGVSGFDPDQHRNTQICVDLVEQWSKKDRKVSVFLRLGHPFHIKLYGPLLSAIYRKGGKLSLVIEFRNILKEQEISRKHHDKAIDFTPLEIGSQHSLAPNSASDRGSTSVLTPDHVDSLFSQFEEVAVSNVQITCCSATSMAIYTALNKMKKLTSLNSVVIICTEPLLSKECISLEETFEKCLDVLQCNLRDNSVPYIYGVEGDEIKMETLKQNLADNKPKESFFLRQCDPNPFLNAILKRGDLKDGNHDNVTSFEMTKCHASYSDQIDMCKRLSVFRIGCLQIDYPEGKIDLATFQAFISCVTAMASLQTLSMKGWAFQTDMHDSQIWIDLWGRLFVKLHHINLSSSLPSDRSTQDAETHPIIRGLCQAKESPESACVSVDLSDNILSEGDVAEMSRINVEVRRNNCDMSERSQHLLDIDGK